MTSPLAMNPNGAAAFALLHERVGEHQGVGAWLRVTQDRIDAFADVTEDRQFIHVDPERSARFSPWGVTVAHGFLVLSLLTRLCETIPQPPEPLVGLLMGINYGFDRARSIAPVRVGSNIRAGAVLTGVERRPPNMLQVTRTVTVEIEGEGKPALVAEWVILLAYA